MPPGPVAVEADAFSFFFLDAAVGSFRFGLDPEVALSFGNFSFFFFPFFFKTSAIVGPSTLIMLPFFFLGFASNDDDLSLLFFIFFIGLFSPLFLVALPVIAVAAVMGVADGLVMEDGCLSDVGVAAEGCGLEGKDDEGTAVVIVWAFF